jgi:hypothetical protein
MDVVQGISYSLTILLMKRSKPRYYSIGPERFCADSLHALNVRDWVYTPSRVSYSEHSYFDHTYFNFLLRSEKVGYQSVYDYVSGSNAPFNLTEVYTDFFTVSQWHDTPPS